MCKSQKEGGQRCAAHTRPRYEDALRNVEAGHKSLADLEEFEEAATEYASTPEGQQRVHVEMIKAETRKDWERLAALRTALVRGNALHAANEETAAVVAKASNAGTVEWSAVKPIWPKRETTSKVIEDVALPSEFDDLVKRAFLGLYAEEWSRKFFQKGPRAVPPENDAEGWQWRREATESATSKMEGATPVIMSMIRPGMAVSWSGRPKVVSRTYQVGDKIRIRFVDGHDATAGPSETILHVPLLDAK